MKYKKEVRFCESCGGSGLGCPDCEHGIIEEIVRPEEEKKEEGSKYESYEKWKKAALKAALINVEKNGAKIGASKEEIKATKKEVEQLFEGETKSRPCNCGSGEDWASCRANSPYCG